MQCGNTMGNHTVISISPHTQTPHTAAFVQLQASHDERVFNIVHPVTINCNNWGEHEQAPF